MRFSGISGTLLALLLLTACAEWFGQARSGAIIGRSTETNVIARSNDIYVGNDMENLQAAAFELFAGKSREDVVLLLEKQGFGCAESKCTYVRRYRDSFWAANFGIGQREKLPGSRLNMRLESTTVYTIAIQAARIDQIKDIWADVSITSNYD
jgi:hypothetical protein